jgi:hypothetical protein
MAARAALNTILRDAAKTPLLRMTVPLATTTIKISSSNTTPRDVCHAESLPQEVIARQ